MFYISFKVEEDTIDTRLPSDSQQGAAYSQVREPLCLDVVIIFICLFLSIVVTSLPQST